MIAAEKCFDTRVFKRLIASGAEVNAIGSEWPQYSETRQEVRSPLMILAGRGGKETIDIAQVLVQAGANVDLANDVSIGQTPLILSVKSLADGYGEIDMLDFLISRGANVNARDSSGNTPIRLARSGKLATYPLRRSEYVALIERLKRAGAKD